MPDLPPTQPPAAPEGPDPDALPPGLAEALRAAEPAPARDPAREAAFVRELPQALAQAKVDAARARMQLQRRRVRWFGGGLAAAAALGLVLMATVFRAPPPGGPTGDIRDAFALARALRDGRPAGAAADANGDGAVDQQDVAALARRAVALRPAAAGTATALAVASGSSPMGRRQAPAWRGAEGTLVAWRSTPPTHRTGARCHAAHDGRLLAFDLRLDPHGAPLACWQLEVKGPPGLAFVTAEGGAGAFAEAPWYDPSASAAALSEVKLAQFSLKDRAALPAADGTVAVLHAWWEGPGDPVLQVAVQAATDEDGNDIPADASARSLPELSTPTP